MESIWWAFKELYDKGKIYEGEKVLMYCTRDATPLSKAEVAMDNSYKEVEDNFIKLPRWKKEKTKLLKTLPYPKLSNTPNVLLDEKERNIRELYAKVNFNLRASNNPDLIIKTNTTKITLKH